MRVEEASTKRAMFGMPAKDSLRWRERSDLFQTSAPFARDRVTLGGIDTPDQMFAIRTEGRLFTMLGARAAVGREGAAPATGLRHSPLLRRVLWAPR